MSLAAKLRERAPHLFLALRTLRYGLRPERLDAETAAVAHALCGSELRVLSGPFAGLRYLPFASGSGLLPKLVGSDELEIHPAVEAAVGRGYRRVINIGCGEGYYAVGFARRLPEAQIHAFDTDIVARRRARQLARRNGVADRVRVRGLCRTEDLRILTGAGSLIVCDCEGCEIRLLDPIRVPELAATDLIVELHDFIDPRISATLLERFRATHRIEIFSMADRSALRLPEVEALSPTERERALWEGRPEGMQWAWLEARRPERRG
ncbi:MAG TPA: methyltransferase [Thermoanaerobaculia bacterium]|nr:methyltransferase [Thermoanaerobaculia bacterium]